MTHLPLLQYSNKKFTFTMQTDDIGNKIIHENGFRDHICFDDKIKIAIIGLGYVGLSLYCQFSKSYSCIGYDIDSCRIKDIANGIDSKNSIERNDLLESISHNKVTNRISDIASCNFFIVTVPTPIDSNSKPNVIALKNACMNLSSIIRKNSIIVFESTVYPGATEELCVPLLCKSGLEYNQDFYVGYSPERINVGDYDHQISKVSKIVSGSSPAITNLIGSVYQSVLEKPIVIASSIKVAEAAKMYENIQRDTLIALANEYSDYCRMEGISIEDVTSCASSKWNFSNVKPGLVGGHCISVDPYYLLERCKSLNSKMALVSQARQINESKANKVTQLIINYIDNKKHQSDKRNVLILGFSYKPNCGDIRNTKIINVIRELKQNNIQVDCYDPLVDSNAVSHEYKFDVLTSFPSIQNYDVVIKMVEHKIFDDFIPGECEIINLDYFL